MGEVLGIKMLGFGLGVAVIVDATIVRTVLVTSWCASAQSSPTKIMSSVAFLDRHHR